MNTLVTPQDLRSSLDAVLRALSVLRARPKPARGSRKFATLDGLNDHLLADISLMREHVDSRRT